MKTRAGLVRHAGTIVPELSKKYNPKMWGKQATMTTIEPAALLVLTTLPAEADTDAFARALVEARLAACVSALPPMDSVYSWRGATERARERQIVVKTSADRAEALMARIRALHPYDVPELLLLPVAGGGADYLAWLSAATLDKAEG